jgi:ADP-ribosyl-[dinitrogen reductase] hydrolase
MTDAADDPAAERDALAQVARLRGRFQGALLGLAVGEALAAPALYGRPGAFPPVRDLLGGGPLDLPRGAWSAHSALAFATARSLLDTGHCDPADQLARWRRWQREGEGSATGECLGISASVARALVDGAPDPASADGVDALTRVAPFAMRHLADSAAMQRAVRCSAALTAHEPATFVAAAAFAGMMQAALRGADVRTVLAAGDGPAQGGLLATVVRSFAAGDGWKATVLRAVNLGGAADAAGALAGQLAGAYHGVAAIPAAWLDALAQREAIIALADALLAEVLVELAEAA